MKVILTAISILLLQGIAFSQSKNEFNDTTSLQPVEITAIRAGSRTPVAQTNLSRAELKEKNIGQDLPFILNHTPSVVVHSDAGNGIGYTGIRIRGSDASRINVTLNGIPYNDAESQGTFFVDLPDIASSTGSIQVQRGVGTSSNGSGSFGGSINLSTNEPVLKKNIEVNNTAGSFHSFKNTFAINSGLLGKHLTVDGRLSNIRSDGYIERASSRLQSVFGSVAWLDSSYSLRFNYIYGKAKTYQAWYGVNEEMLVANRRFNSAGTELTGQPYTNETDNYTQTHYQLFFNQRINKSWKTGLASFFTKGKGYYEQYKAQQRLSSYGLPDYNDGTSVISRTDLIRQLWLDNDFYGNTVSVEHQISKRNLIFGGGWNTYKGQHFGQVTKAQVQAAVPVNYRWYDVPAIKKELSFFGKWTEELWAGWSSFADIQVRNVEYRIDGFRNNPSLLLFADYLFVNPKAGIMYSAKGNTFYASYGKAEKEPNRQDFETGLTEKPRSEKLHDFELGMRGRKDLNSWAINFYYMKYKDQLVLNGKINDVGAYTRINIPDSYRAGVEFEANAQIKSWFAINANLTLSKNKVQDFVEYIDDYDNGTQISNTYKNSTIAFSPSITGFVALNFQPVENTQISLQGKYISRQYLDNTEQKSRSLDGYYVQDARITYSFKDSRVNAFKLFVQGNNLFSKKFEPNGYTFSYISSGQLTTENYYFPMAPFNWMMGLVINF